VPGGCCIVSHQAVGCAPPRPLKGVTRCYVYQVRAVNFFFPPATLLTRLRSWFTDPAQIDEPIRAELFSIERLEQHAESLAAAQPVTATTHHKRRLLARVQENGRILLGSYRSIAQAIREEHAITPAAEWLVDNFHIVEEQVREIRDDLPPGYYRQLPKLAAGPLEGYPRVFGLVWAFVAHTDSRFDPEALRRFVRAYQRVQPLTIGELWAVAITLRVVLVENLRRLTEQMVRGRAARQAADALADNLLGLETQSTVPKMTSLRPLEGAPLVTAFAVQLALRLRDQDPAVVPALRWLDERLAAQGTTADDIVRLEHQRQEAMNVTVRNVITSMRLISTFDWAEFFESVSLVDEVLRVDSNFVALDFATRDRYRHAIEELARGSQHSELEIARRVIAQTKRAAPPCQRTTALSAELLSHLERADRFRARTRLSRVPRSVATACLCHRGDAWLPWHDFCHRRNCPCSAATHCQSLWDECCGAVVTRAVCRRTGVGLGGCVGESCCRRPP
jgi:hypothetical protein